MTSVTNETYSNICTLATTPHRAQNVKHNWEEGFSVNQWDSISDAGLVYVTFGAAPSRKALWCSEWCRKRWMRENWQRNISLLRKWIFWGGRGRRSIMTLHAFERFISDFGARTRKASLTKLDNFFLKIIFNGRKRTFVLFYFIYCTFSILIYLSYYGKAKKERGGAFSPRKVKTTYTEVNNLK